MTERRRLGDLPERVRRRDRSPWYGHIPVRSSRPGSPAPNDSTTGLVNATSQSARHISRSAGPWSYGRVRSAPSKPRPELRIVRGRSGHAANHSPAATHAPPVPARRPTGHARHRRRRLLQRWIARFGKQQREPLGKRRTRLRHLERSGLRRHSDSPDPDRKIPADPLTRCFRPASRPTYGIGSTVPAQGPSTCSGGEGMRALQLVIMKPCWPDT